MLVLMGYLHEGAAFSSDTHASRNGGVGVGQGGAGRGRVGQMAVPGGQMPL